MLKIVESLWAVAAPLRTPPGELTAPPGALAGEEGIAAPPKVPTLGLRPFCAGPCEKSWTRPDHLHHHSHSSLGGCRGFNASESFVDVSICYRNNSNISDIEEIL